MTIRARFRFALASWLVLGMLVLIWAVHYGGFRILLLFALQFSIAAYCLSLRCPQCKKPVLHNPIRLFGNQIYIWTSWIPKRCPKCGREQ